MKPTAEMVERARALLVSKHGPVRPLGDVGQRHPRGSEGGVNVEDIEHTPCILCDDTEYLEVIHGSGGYACVECGMCGLRAPWGEGFIGSAREWNSLSSAIREAEIRGATWALEHSESVPTSKLMPGAQRNYEAEAARIVDAKRGEGR